MAFVSLSPPLLPLLPLVLVDEEATSTWHGSENERKKS
jgi:hypothetical protein